jgi:hypothetical protein
MQNSSETLAPPRIAGKRIKPVAKDRATDVLRTFAPRPLRPDEHALVAEWRSRTIDIASAYVCEQRSDDPSFYRKIVIATGSTTAPLHLVHAPSGPDCWIVVTQSAKANAQQFGTLKDALNSIWPVLPD